MEQKRSISDESKGGGAGSTLAGVDNVHRVLAVASGKGGVGKTTIAVNLALALIREGRRVGLLDADVYGPSVPLMLGLTQRLRREHGTIVPANKFGLRIMSLGMTVEDDQAFILRGPMVSKAIRLMLTQVEWGELDYLVVDLPPGTGDPSITVAQSLPEVSVLIVTTPQKVALSDVRRAVGLFRKLDRRIIGLVENMAYFNCGHSAVPIEIFGHGGGEEFSRETGIPLLVSIPLDLEIRKGGDEGVPLMASAPISDAGQLFQSLAKKIVEMTARPIRELKKPEGKGAPDRAY